MSLEERYAALPDWCTPEEVAEFLGVSVKFVYRLLEEGRFSVQWRGHDRGRWSIAKEAVAEFAGMRPGAARGTAV